MQLSPARRTLLNQIGLVILVAGFCLGSLIYWSAPPDKGSASSYSVDDDPSFSPEDFICDSCVPPKSKVETYATNACLFIFGGTFVFLALGGIYVFPAIYITKGREPWLTLLLSVCLGINVLLVAYGPPRLPYGYALGAWALSVGLLLIRRRRRLDHSVESFVFTYLLSIVLTGVAAILVHHNA